MLKTCIFVFFPAVSFHICSNKKDCFHFVVKFIIQKPPVIEKALMSSQFHKCLSLLNVKSRVFWEIPALKFVQDEHMLGLDFILSGRAVWKIVIF